MRPPSAQELGIPTVLVGRDPADGPVPGADHVVLSLHELPRMWPQLVDQPGLVHAAPAAAVHAAAVEPVAAG